MVKLEYYNTIPHMVEELTVVAVGPLSVFAIFLLLVLLCLIWQKAIGSFPEIGHKFIFCLGLQALLDPLFITLIDLAMGVRKLILFSVCCRWKEGTVQSQSVVHNITVTISLR